MDLTIISKLIILKQVNTFLLTHIRINFNFIMWSAFTCKLALCPFYAFTLQSGQSPDHPVVLLVMSQYYPQTPSHLHLPIVYPSFQQRATPYLFQEVFASPTNFFFFFLCVYAANSFTNEQHIRPPCVGSLLSQTTK